MEQPSDFLKARLAKLPPPPPSSSVKEDIQDDTTDTSTETDSSTASVQTVVPTGDTIDSPEFVVPKPPPKLFARPSDPVSWTKYFRENIKVASTTDPAITFNVYYSPPTAETAPVYVFHHGAGSSGLSFALVAAHLTMSISCGVLAYDVRYHGSTLVNDRAEWNLSLETLAQDQVDVVNGVSKHASWDSRNEGWPDLILVGHRYHHLAHMKATVVIVVLEERYRHILRRITYFRPYVCVSSTSWKGQRWTRYKVCRLTYPLDPGRSSPLNKVYNGISILGQSAIASRLGLVSLLSYFKPATNGPGGLISQKRDLSGKVQPVNDRR